MSGTRALDFVKAQILSPLARHSPFHVRQFPEEQGHAFAIFNFRLNFGAFNAGCVLG
jgi:hypothetical protein